MMGYIMPLASGIMAFAANASVLPLDLMFFYTPEKAFAMIDKYGEAGRALYMKIELTADIIYPIVYTLFYGLLLSWLMQRAYKPESAIQKLNAMPAGPGCSICLRMWELSRCLPCIPLNRPSLPG